jgi:hydroxymethylpyrimidine pyrophosphatase-like HAD family hydrolase
VKKLIVFDLDGTLAGSKSPLDSEMSGLLHDLLLIVKVAVISGGDCRSSKNNCSPIFPITTTWQICLSFQPAEQSCTDTTQRHGKRFIRKI